MTHGRRRRLHGVPLHSRVLSTVIHRLTLCVVTFALGIALGSAVGGYEIGPGHALLGVLTFGVIAAGGAKALHTAVRLRR